MYFISDGKIIKYV